MVGSRDTTISTSTSSIRYGSHAGGVEAALIAYEQDLFPRSAPAAAEVDRSIKLFFAENSPQTVVDLFTCYQSVQ
jgi:hypothetical protein